MVCLGKERPYMVGVLPVKAREMRVLLWDEAEESCGQTVQSLSSEYNGKPLKVSHD